MYILCIVDGQGDLAALVFSYCTVEMDLYLQAPPPARYRRQGRLLYVEVCRLHAVPYVVYEIPCEISTF